MLVLDRVTRSSNYFHSVTKIEIDLINDTRPKKFFEHFVPVLRIVPGDICHGHKHLPSWHSNANIDAKHSVIIGYDVICVMRPDRSSDVDLECVFVGTFE